MDIAVFPTDELPTVLRVLRTALVQLAALAVLLGRPIKTRSLLFLKELAQQLATHDGVIDVIEALHEGRHLKARLLTMRRAFKALFKEAWRAESYKGVLRFVAAAWFGRAVNVGRVSRHRARACRARDHAARRNPAGQLPGRQSPRGRLLLHPVRDFWPLMALPLAEARARCALLPKLAAAPAIRLAA